MALDFTSESQQKEYIETRLKLGGSVMTTVFVEADDGEVRAFGLGFNTTAERDDCVITMRQVLKKMRAKQYSFISQVQTGNSQYDAQQCVMFITCKRSEPGHQTWLWELQTENGVTTPVNPSRIEDSLAEFSEMFDEEPLKILSYAQRKKVEKRAIKMLAAKPQKLH